MRRSIAPRSTAIEARLGVPGSVVLAIWGLRNRLFGRYTLPYDARLRVLATQAYVGKRKDQYRTEFILALKLIGDKVVTRKDLRSSWAGATGLPPVPALGARQGIFVDFDGDGHPSISGNRCRTRWLRPLQQLVNKGWQPGVRWAYEVQAPSSADCTQGVPEVTKPIGRMAAAAGRVPARGQSLSAAEQSAAGLAAVQPEGIYGPAFLTTKNYFVIKEYNFTRPVCPVRGPSLRSHVEPAAVRDAVVGVDPVAHQRCRVDAASSPPRLGLYADKLDGKAECRPRAALGAYQKSAGLKVDCWPSDAVLALDQRGAL